VILQASTRAIAGRAGVLGLVSGALASGAHWIASGELLPPGLLVALAALVGVLAMPLLRRERGLAWILVVLGSCQTAPHLVLSEATHVQDHETSPARPGWMMMVLHALAVVVAAWWLRHGEAAFWTRARRVIKVAGALLGRKCRRLAERSRTFIDVRVCTQDIPARPPRPLIDRISGRGPPCLQ
jgi:hypothetical protein